jgi:hypothetical protein
VNSKICTRDRLWGNEFMHLFFFMYEIYSAIFVLSFLPLSALFDYCLVTHKMLSSSLYYSPVLSLVFSWWQTMPAIHLSKYSSFFHWQHICYVWWTCFQQTIHISMGTECALPSFAKTDFMHGPLMNKKKRSSVL